MTDHPDDLLPGLREQLLDAAGRACAAYARSTDPSSIVTRSFGKDDLKAATAALLKARGLEVGDAVVLEHVAMARTFDLVALDDGRLAIPVDAELVRWSSPLEVATIAADVVDRLVPKETSC